MLAISPKCKQATLWTNNLGTYPAPKTVQAVSQFMSWELNNGNWQATDQIFLLAQDNQTNSCVGLVQPTLTPATQINNPSWTAYQGFTGNGTNSYINTKYTPTGTDNVSGFSGLFAVYNLTTGTDAGGHGVIMSNAIGGLGQTFIAMTEKFTDNNMYAIVDGDTNDFVATAITNTSPLGLQTTYRASAVTPVTFSFSKLTQLYTASSARQPHVPFEIFVGARDNATTGVQVAANFSSRQIALVIIGGRNNLNTQYADVQQLATLLGFVQ